MLFGVYFKTVLDALAMKHGWPDPYLSITPVYDPQGHMLKRILQEFDLGTEAERVAARFNADYNPDILLDD